MELKQVFDWALQPDGLYTIFGLQIMHPYDTREFKDGRMVRENRGNATEEDLADAVRTFRRNRCRGQYPRGFIGHHINIENRVGCGFLDNVRMCGQNVVADLVNIPPERFQEIQRQDYPYRSPEYLWKQKRLTGLALLSSQEPFFTYPMIFLADNPIDFSMAGEEVAACFQMRFQMRADFVCGGGDMPEDYEDEDENTVEESADEPMDEEPEKFDMNSLASGCEEIKTMLKQVIEMLGGLVQLEEEEQESREDFGGEMQESEKPSSVAYQMRANFQALNRRIAHLERSKNDQSLNSELQRFCNASGENFEFLSGVMGKFSSNADRKTFLAALKDGQASGFSMHPMSRDLDRFRGAAIDSIGAATKKHSSNQRDYKIAREAAEAYRDTIFQPNNDSPGKFCLAARSFARTWKIDIDADPMGGLEGFVDFVVEQCRFDPDYLRKMTSPA